MEVDLYIAAWSAKRLDDSDHLHGHELLQADEISRIPGVEEKTVSRSRGGDQQISQAGSTGSSYRRYGGKDTPVHPRGIRVEWQGVPGCCRPLQPVLTSSAFLLVPGGVRSRRQLRKGHSSNGRFVRQQIRVNHVQIDHHRSIQQALGRTLGRLSHQGTGLLRHPDRPEPPGINPRSPLPGFRNCRPWHEPMRVNRPELGNRHPVAGHNHGFARLYFPEYGRRLIAEFTLGNSSVHDETVTYVALCSHTLSTAEQARHAFTSHLPRRGRLPLLLGHAGQPLHLRGVQFQTFSHLGPVIRVRLEEDGALPELDALLRPT